MSRRAFNGVVLFENTSMFLLGCAACAAGLQAVRSIRSGSQRSRLGTKSPSQASASSARVLLPTTSHNRSRKRLGCISNLLNSVPYGPSVPSRLIFDN